jgi:hypothetical protein
MAFKDLLLHGEEGLLSGLLRYPAQGLHRCVCSKPFIHIAADPSFCVHKVSVDGTAVSLKRYFEPDFKFRISHVHFPISLRGRSNENTQVIAVETPRSGYTQQRFFLNCPFRHALGPCALL